MNQMWVPLFPICTGWTFSIFIDSLCYRSWPKPLLSALWIFGIHISVLFFFSPCSLFLRHILKCCILSSFWVREKPFRQGMGVERERTNVSWAAVKCNFGSGNLHSIQTKWYRHPHYVNVKESGVPSVTHIGTGRIGAQPKSEGL